MGGIIDTLKTTTGFNMMDSFMNPDRAYKKAQRPINQGWQDAQKYEEPYWQHGLDQYGNLNNAENSLLNPEQLTNQWSQGYEQSPFAKQLMEENQNQGMDAASSMGLMGSSAAINNIQQGAGKIMNADRREYLNDLMQKYMTGIGIGQNIYNTGANAGGTLGNQAMQRGEDLSGLVYNQYAAPGKLGEKVIGAMANFMGGGMGGMGGGMGSGSMGGNMGGGGGISNNSYLNW